MAEPQKLNCGVLGATGSVGQRLLQLLEKHPWFQISVLGASERSAGKLYTDCIHWVLDTPIPAHYGALTVKTCTPAEFAGCSFVFSALDNNVAGPIEVEFAKAGIAVFSNSKNHRMDSDVPILLPLVNPDHMKIVERQRKEQGYTKGFIVTNANCSSTGLVVALKPLQVKYGIKKVSVVTMQAISGAGYPGVSAYDITSNVIPFISGEEEKMETEPLKMLGSVVEQEGGKGLVFQDAKFGVSAQCNRVPVMDGHTLCVSVELEGNPSAEEVTKVLQTFQSPANEYQLPSAPKIPISVTAQQNHPQPRIDLGDGFVTLVGRVRPCPLMTVKMVILTHNTVIGAAGGAILNAELAKSMKYI